MAARRPRIRDLGVDVWNHPTGRLNLITDVEGVAVGHATIIRGRSAPGRTKGVVRTGVTAVTVRGRDLFMDPIAAAAYAINGFGKATGLDQIRETGRIETAIAITNTLSIWTAAETLVRMTLETHPDVRSVCPVVGECNDGYLSDIRGFHVKPGHVRRAVRGAGRRFELGSIGAGTGMRGIGFKSGVGSSSRVVAYGEHDITFGVLTVANTGELRNLRIAGLPVGRALQAGAPAPQQKGSIIFVLATDGEFTSRQLRRLAVRVGHGFARTGMTSSHTSGDFVIAFSTRQAPELSRRKGLPRRAGRLYVREEDMSPLFEAVVEASEEAYIDAVMTAESMNGADGRRVEAVDVEAVRGLLRRAGLAR